MATSAEPNSGKTTLLGVIGFLVPRSLCTVGTTEAVLFRSMERWDPTIIVDEADTLLVHNEPLRAVINSGWTRGSGVPRCGGGDKDPRVFSTFCPKAIGIKGRKLPDTTMSRCIIIELRRKKPSDRVDHFDHIDNAELVNLRRQAQRWAMDNVATLKSAVPELPPGFDNRLGDNWRLMLAIANAAEGEWPDQARQAATAVAKVADPGVSIGVKLLADIRDIFASKAVGRIPSAELVEALVQIEGRPWVDWKRGKPITQNALALQLAPFAIASGNIRVGPDRVVKGYQAAQFRDAFERYL
jgi:putative DNA primase/helicase